MSMAALSDKHAEDNIRQAIVISTSHNSLITMLEMGGVASSFADKVLNMGWRICWHLCNMCWHDCKTYYQ